jgi:hypothetical protein
MVYVLYRIPVYSLRDVISVILSAGSDYINAERFHLLWAGYGPVTGRLRAGLAAPDSNGQA